ncbi:MAG TPA: hypothetical protein VKC60_00505, partial [Opitutaceae bacterium]|nr:hypothetical protein [Opitutaceae bacterium]
IVTFTDATKDTPNVVRIWDFKQHKEALRLPFTSDDGKRWDFYRAILSSDGSKVAVVFITGRILEARWKLEVFDLNTLARLSQRFSEHRITALGFSPDNRKLAYAFGDTAEILVEDLVNQRELWRKTIGVNETNGLIFSPEGDTIAMTCRDATIRLIKTDSGEVLSELHGHDAGVQDIVWTSTNRRLLSVGTGGDLREWFTPKKNLRHEIDGFWAPAGGNRNVVLSEDGELFAAGIDGQSLRILNTDSLSTERTLKGASVALGFEQNHHELLSLTKNGTLQRWNMGSNAQPIDLFSMVSANLTIGYTSLSAKHDLLVVSDATGQIEFWNLKMGQLIAKQKAHKGAFFWSTISADGQIVVTGEEDDLVKIWDGRSGRLQGELKLNSRPSNAAISNDNKYLVVSYYNGEVEIRELKTRVVLRRIQTETSRITGLVFLPDNSRLICGGANSTVYVYNTADWREIITFNIKNQLQTHGDSTIEKLAVSDQGNALIAYRGDGFLRVWRTSKKP